MTEKAIKDSAGPTEVTAQNTWVTLKGLDVGQRVAISGRSNSLSGVWRLQRLLAGDTNWNDVTDIRGTAISFTDIGAEFTYETDAGCDLRAGIATGDYTSGGVFVHLRKG
jgi:hypothetical protein